MKLLEVFNLTHAELDAQLEPYFPGLISEELVHLAIKHVVVCNMAVPATVANDLVTVLIEYANIALLTGSLAAASVSIRQILSGSSRMN